MLSLSSLRPFPRGPARLQSTGSFNVHALHGQQRLSLSPRCQGRLTPSNKAILDAFSGKRAYAAKMVSTHLFGGVRVHDLEEDQGWIVELQKGLDQETCEAVRRQVEEFVNKIVSPSDVTVVTR